MKKCKTCGVDAGRLDFLSPEDWLSVHTCDPVCKVYEDDELVQTRRARSPEDAMRRVLPLLEETARFDCPL